MITFKKISYSEAIRTYFTSGLLTESERIGQWIGKGCEDYGFSKSTPILPADFSMALRGYSPTGERLFQRMHSSRRAGYDFVFSGDKSVSVAALCVSTKEREKITGIFAEAVTNTWELADSLARASHRENGWKNSHGLISARFCHYASRHNDPHLHAHTVTLNCSTDNSGQVANLDPRGILTARKSLDNIFQHIFWHRLKTAGYDAKKNSQGKATLPVHASICEAFSKANRVIRDAVAAVRRPDAFKSISDVIWAGILNDRTRPQKTKAPDFLTILPQETIEEVEFQIKSLEPQQNGSLGNDVDADECASLIARQTRKMTLFPTPVHAFSATDHLLKTYHDVSPAILMKSVNLTARPRAKITVSEITSKKELLHLAEIRKRKRLSRSRTQKNSPTHQHAAQHAARI